jgi:hypothetical protein
MEAILTSKVILIAWMLDVTTLKVHYFMPMMVKTDDAECRKALSDIQEVHKRGYNYNLVIRGACLPAG